MHTAGGALVAGLGGGSAAGGVAGAGVSAALAGDLNRLADTMGNGGGTDPGLAADNIAGNLIAGGTGGLIGGNSGAVAGANADLYNRSSGNGEGKGSTENSLAGRVWDAVVNTATDPLGSLNYVLNSLIPAPQNPKPDADPNPLIDAHGGNPTPPTGGAVVTPPTVICAAGGACVTVPGAATASMPPNAMFAQNDRASGDNATSSVLGADGAQFASKTVWKGDGKERIDVENPNPGQRPGQIHYQDNQGNKYLYDPSTNSFPGAPNSVNRLLNDPSFSSAIAKGLNKYLGGK